MTTKIKTIDNRAYMLYLLALCAIFAVMLYIHFMQAAIRDNIARENLLLGMGVAQDDYRGLESFYMKKLAEITEENLIEDGFVKITDIHFVRADTRLARQ